MASDVLKKFYNSTRWKDFRLNLIAERGNICERCGKIITDGKKLHAHHKAELTVYNVDDYNVSLNPDMVELICNECHNKEHSRFGYKSDKTVTIVYGPPLSGKTSYVMKHKGRNDLVVDMDKLFQAVTLLDEYDKPDSLKFNVFAIRDTLIDNIKTRYGRFEHAWIVGGYPITFDRERLARELDADIIFMDVSKEECYKRLQEVSDWRLSVYEEWKNYIDMWFEKNLNQI